jgi:RNA polymerase sigma factor (sigma-70 family)
MLVARAAGGDREAFAEAVGRHTSLLRALCQRMLGDHGLADDAVQEAILHAFLSLDRLREPPRFGAWLAGIGLNICRRWLRAKASTGALSLDDLLGGQRVREPIDSLRLDPAWVAEEHELATRIRRAVQALPTGQRTTIVLFYLSGLSHAEIAAALGIPTGAVKTRLHKARANLRRELWSLWEELHPMSAETGHDTSVDYVDARVIDVRRVLPDERYAVARNVVLLQEADGDQRILGVWVGSVESEAILILLSGVETERPLTFAFTNRLLQASGAVVREVRVNRLAGETFWAETVVQTAAGEERVIDARPSDAIALALEAKAPIRIANVIMDEASHSPARGDSDSVAVDGKRVLGKVELWREMEQRRQQRDAEMQQVLAEIRQKRAAQLGDI